MTYAMIDNAVGGKQPEKVMLDLNIGHLHFAQSPSNFAELVVTTEC